MKVVIVTQKNTQRESRETVDTAALCIKPAYGRNWDDELITLRGYAEV